MKRSTKSRRRPYRLGRRAETAEETRRRLVEATFQLHSEQGIAETSMKDIAARAGVSVGTVYHHFPSYTDAIVACAGYTSEHAPAPTAAVFAGAASRRERIARLARALFDFYERVPALESVRRDRQLSRELDAFAEEEARNRRALVAEAVGADAPVAFFAALLDVDVYRSVRREGFGTAEAADRVAAMINLALESTAGASRR
jgi:AcrR family transcriptional regulator